MITKVNEAHTSKTCSLCGEAHKSGRVKRGLFKCPCIGKVINADLNGAINILHIPESLRSRSGGQLLVRDKGNGLKTQPVVYRWMNEAGWVNPTSYDVMKMKAVNHKPMICPGGTLTLQGGEEVRFSTLSITEYIKKKYNETIINTAISIKDGIIN